MGLARTQRFKSVLTALTAPISRLLSIAMEWRLLRQKSTQHKEDIVTPACVKACPADALRFGERKEMLKEAHNRISSHPDKYVDHIYGEKEAGGTSVLYLSSVPFEKIGFPDVGEKPFPEYSKVALGAVPPAVLAMGALLGSAYAFFKRRAAAVAGSNAAHVEFETLPYKLLTPFNWVMLALIAFCGVSLLARFVLGLGGSTHLSDTYPWGLWIVFDLVWIAVAAGAFATAGIIYVFQRKDLYSMGRTAVLTGLLSYTFVTVTLIADLGLPWHFYQLGLQAPDHSAMFEVSWCVGLYVTILLFEFLPVPLERWGLQRAMDLWKRWSGAVCSVCGYVVCLSAFPQPDLCGAECCLILLPGLGIQEHGQKARAHHAGHRGCNSFHHAPEFAWLVVPAHA